MRAILISIILNGEKSYLVLLSLTLIAEKRFLCFLDDVIEVNDKLIETC